MEINLKKLNERINILGIKTNKFKSSKIEITFLMPSVAGNTAAISLLPFYLTRTTEKYNTPEKLCSKLAELYGASLATVVAKKGDNIEQSIRISSIADSLAFDGEKVFDDMLSLLCEVIFAPNAKDGQFDLEYLENEKRLALERIESEINDKRKYAVKRAVEIMCKDEPFGNSKYGSKEELEAVDPQNLFNAYKKVLASAQINITVISNTDIDFNHKFFKKLAGLEYDNTVKNENILKSARAEVLTENEPMDVNQGKLVIGFRNNQKKTVKESVKSKMMADVFGGGPYSLLFENVREKESLCYYCATVYDRNKELMIVDSGVEFDNLEKTKNEIMKYFRKLQKGDFDKSVFDASKKGMTEAYLAISDSIDSLCAWYSSQLGTDEIVSPTEYIDFIKEVSIDDIVNAAKQFEPDTVFCITQK